MRLLLSFLVSFLLLLSFAAAAGTIYVTDVDIATDDFAVTETIQGTDDDIVYSVTPTNFKHVTITLKGDGYAPMLYVFDPNEGKYLYQEEASSSSVELSFTYTSGYNGASPQEVQIVVVDHGTAGSTYTLTVTAEDQDDAGKGTDAPKGFRDGLLIESGEYTGFLGGGDLIDHYSMDLEQDETISITVTPEEPTSYHFTLVDSSYFTRVDTRSQLDESELRAVYSSLKDQRVYFGIEGDQPYTLLVESDATPVPDEPSPIPTPVAGVPEPEPIAQPEAPVDDDDSQSLGLLLMIIAIVLLVLLGAAMFLSKKKSAKKGSKKPAKK